MDRRHFLASAAGAAVIASTPRFLVAESRIGSGTLRTVSDGRLLLPADFILGTVPEADRADLATIAGVSDGQIQAPCNVTLWQDGDRTVLFDAGAGHDFMPTAGEVIDSLAAAGVAPEDVTHVVFTHAHPDHLWGVLDDFDDPWFPNAEHMIGEEEFAYWTDPATVETIGAARQSFAVGARRRLEAIEDRFTLFAADAEVLPGIVALPTFGHTPGHMSFAIGSGADEAVVIGDAIGNDHVSLRHPGLALGSDQDPETAAARRVRLLDRLASDAPLVVGFHFGGGGLGRIVAEGEGYRFEPT